MGDPQTPALISALSLPVTMTDRLVVGRGNDLKRHDFPAWRGSISNRRIPAVPQSSTFSTWVNQDTAVVTDLADGFRINRPTANNSTNSVHCRVRSIPGGSWDVRLGCIRGSVAKDSLECGLILRESGTGKLQTWYMGASTTEGEASHAWSSPTAFGSVRFSGSGSTAESPWLRWFRVVKNGSNMDFYCSPDGAVWDLAFTDTLTGSFTTAPNQWGAFLISTNNSTPNLLASADFIDWSE